MATLKTCFDEETIALMRSALDEAWVKLGPVEQDRASRTEFAARI
jgi:hypothetical protein